MLQADTFADLPIADLVVQMTTGNDFDTIYGVLGSYRTFSTSRQLLEELRARELFVRNRSQLARNRVLNVLKIWISSFWSDFAADLLELEEICEDWIQDIEETEELRLEEEKKYADASNPRSLSVSILTVARTIRSDLNVRKHLPFDQQQQLEPLCPPQQHVPHNAPLATKRNAASLTSIEMVDASSSSSCMEETVLDAPSHLLSLPPTRVQLLPGQLGAQYPMTQLEQAPSMTGAGGEFVFAVDYGNTNALNYVGEIYLDEADDPLCMYKGSNTNSNSSNSNNTNEGNGTGENSSSNNSTGSASSPRKQPVEYPKKQRKFAIGEERAYGEKGLPPREAKRIEETKRQQKSTEDEDDWLNETTQTPEDTFRQDKTLSWDLDDNRMSFMVKKEDMKQNVIDAPDFSVYLLQTYDQIQRKNEVVKFREKLRKVKKFDKYIKFGPRLGKGGFGEVYRAIFQKRTIAVKNIREYGEDSIKEYEIHCALHNMNIISVYYFSTVQDPQLGTTNLWIFMEYCESDMQKYFLNPEEFSVNETQKKAWMFQLLNACDYLHTNAIIHRDLKPGNVLLKQEVNFATGEFFWIPKICDFGTARKFNRDQSKTQSANIGTIMYHAPELWKIRNGKVDTPYYYEVDIWSLGLVFLQLACNMLSAKLIEFISETCEDKKYGVFVEDRVPALIENIKIRYHEAIVMFPLLLHMIAPAPQRKTATELLCLFMLGQHASTSRAKKDELKYTTVEEANRQGRAQLQQLQLQQQQMSQQHLSQPSPQHHDQLPQIPSRPRTHVPDTTPSRGANGLTVTGSGPSSPSKERRRGTAENLSHALSPTGSGGAVQRRLSAEVRPTARTLTQSQSNLQAVPPPQLPLPNPPSSHDQQRQAPFRPLNSPSLPSLGTNPRPPSNRVTMAGSQPDLHHSNNTRRSAGGNTRHQNAKDRSKLTTSATNVPTLPMTASFARTTSTPSLSNSQKAKLNTEPMIGDIDFDEMDPFGNLSHDTTTYLAFDSHHSSSSDQQQRDREQAEASVSLSGPHESSRAIDEFQYNSNARSTPVVDTADARYHTSPNLRTRAVPITAPPTVPLPSVPSLPSLAHSPSPTAPLPALPNSAGACDPGSTSARKNSARDSGDSDLTKSSKPLPKVPTKTLHVSNNSDSQDDAQQASPSPDLPFPQSTFLPFLPTSSITPSPAPILSPSTQSDSSAAIASEWRVPKRSNSAKRDDAPNLNDINNNSAQSDPSMPEQDLPLVTTTSKPGRENKLLRPSGAQRSSAQRAPMGSAQASLTTSGGESASTQPRTRSYGRPTSNRERNDIVRSNVTNDAISLPAAEPVVEPSRPQEESGVGTAVNDANGDQLELEKAPDTAIAMNESLEASCARFGISVIIPALTEHGFSSLLECLELPESDIEKFIVESKMLLGTKAKFLKALKQLKFENNL